MFRPLNNLNCCAELAADSVWHLELSASWQRHQGNFQGFRLHLQSYRHALLWHLYSTLPSVKSICNGMKLSHTRTRLNAYPNAILGTSALVLQGSWSLNRQSYLDKIRRSSKNTTVLASAFLPAQSSLDYVCTNMTTYTDAHGNSHWDVPRHSAPAIQCTWLRSR